MIRNKKGRVVLWFKGKDPEGSASFSLCLYRPGLADDAKTRRQLDAAFGEIRAMAREMGLALFDARELVTQMRAFLGENPRNFIGHEFPIFLTDLASGRRGRLTVVVHAPEAS